MVKLLNKYANDFDKITRKVLGRGFIYIPGTNMITIPLNDAAKILDYYKDNDNPPALIGIIRDGFRSDLMDTKVWTNTFCFEDIYNEADPDFREMVDSLGLYEFEKFINKNDWSKGFEAGINADWPVVANACARDSHMPGFDYILFRLDDADGKWKRYDDVQINVKSESLAMKELREYYGPMVDGNNFRMIFRRITYI